MKTINVGELKANFSEIIKQVAAGEEFAILYGKKKKAVAKLVPISHQGQKRKLGIFDKKATLKFHRDFKISEEEFLGI